MLTTVWYWICHVYLLVGHSLTIGVCLVSVVLPSPPQVKWYITGVGSLTSSAWSGSLDCLMVKLLGKEWQKCGFECCCWCDVPDCCITSQYTCAMTRIWCMLNTEWCWTCPVYLIGGHYLTIGNYIRYHLFMQGRSLSSLWFIVNVKSTWISKCNWWWHILELRARRSLFKTILWSTKWLLTYAL